MLTSTVKDNVKPDFDHMATLEEDFEKVAVHSDACYDSFGNTMKGTSSEFEEDSCSLFDCESGDDETEHFTNTATTTGKQK